MRDATGGAMSDLGGECDDPPSGRDEAARVSTSWAAVGVTVLAGVGVALQIGKLTAALPLVRADLGIGLILAGGLLSAFAVVPAVVGVAVGALVGRVGPGLAVVTGLALAAVGSVAGALAGSGIALLASTALEGSGYVAVVVAAPTLITYAAVPVDRGLVLGVWGTHLPGGQAVMILAAAAVLAVWSWRVLWVAGAVVLLACAVAAAVVLLRGRGCGRSDVVAPTPSRRPGAAAALRHPAARMLALAYGAQSLQFTAVVGFLPTYYTAQGLDAATSNVLTGAVVVANIVGHLVAGVLLRRGARHWVLLAVAATVTGSTSIGVFTLDLPFVATYACALAFSGVGGLAPAAVLAAVPALVSPPALIAVTNGLVVQAVGIGKVIGPLAIGALADASGGWRATPLVVTTAAAVVVVLALRLRRRSPTPVLDALPGP